MHSDFERARRYRERAVELRALTETWREPVARATLEWLAKDFDALADKLDPPRMNGAWPVAMIGAAMFNGTSAHEGSEVNRLVSYQNRAEEIRAIAEDLTQEATRKTLLDLAASYDQWANTIQSESTSVTALSKPAT
jgi:hypothetical protein